MGKGPRRRQSGTLTERQFSQVILARARDERPEAQIRYLDDSLLMVKGPLGNWQMVSLAALYRAYVSNPLEKELLITHFLANLVFDQPPGIEGGFEANRHRVLPQVVPPSLLEFCQRDGHELGSVEFAGDLAIAFVVDEPERYCYISADLLRAWGVSAADLMATALQNLEALSTGLKCTQIGVGPLATYAFERYDGYDASRILLARELVQLAARVAGRLVIGIPHRDYLVACGDHDPEAVRRLQAHVESNFVSHGYPITTQLFTLKDGRVLPYDAESDKPILPN